jgi:hypothetical protein
MGHQNMLWAQGRLQAKLNDSYPLALVDPTTIPGDIQWIVNAGVTYEHLFDKIFFNDPQFGGIQGVTRERFALAIATYERTLVPDEAPIDLGTMTNDEVRGFNLMRTSGCFFCHSVTGNPIFLTPGGRIANPFDNPLSDGQFHNIAFGLVKTPTIRNVGLQVKFFSTGNGNFGNNSIDDIIKFYDNQPGILGFTGTGPGGSLTGTEFKQVKHLFENALTDPRVAAGKFPFDRPQLASERPEFVFEGNEYGVGTPGASNLTPEILCNAPPLVHKPGISANAWFKVGVGNAPANASSILMVSQTPAGGPVFWVGGSITFTPAIVTNAQGIGTTHTPVALTNAVIGIPFFCQWIIADNSTFAFSDAARFTPFQF